MNKAQHLLYKAEGLHLKLFYAHCRNTPPVYNIHFSYSKSVSNHFMLHVLLRNAYIDQNIISFTCKILLRSYEKH